MNSTTTNKQLIHHNSAPSSITPQQQHYSNFHHHHSQHSSNNNHHHSHHQKYNGNIINGANGNTYSSYQQQQQQQQQHQQQQQDQDNNNQLIISNKNTFQTQQPLQWIELEIKGNVKNISPKLWQWTHLKYLYLNDNNLMRLPPVIANLTQLQLLDASNNKIRTLPSEIGKSPPQPPPTPQTNYNSLFKGDMASLRELYLNNNFIRVLPYELGKLFKLQALGIKGNPLTQDITSIYSEVNGTQKLLVHLLDQLTCKSIFYIRRGVGKDPHRRVYSTKLRIIMKIKVHVHHQSVDPGFFYRSHKIAETRVYLPQCVTMFYVINTRLEIFMVIVHHGPYRGNIVKKRFLKILKSTMLI